MGFFFVFSHRVNAAHKRYAYISHSIMRYVIINFLFLTRFLLALVQFVSNQLKISWYYYYFMSVCKSFQDHKTYSNITSCKIDRFDTHKITRFLHTENHIFKWEVLFSILWENEPFMVTCIFMTWLLACHITLLYRVKHFNYT